MLRVTSQRSLFMSPRRVITELDEWPRHQTIDTFDSIASPTMEWSDGYWFCIGDPAGEINLITAIRLYHNTNVMDAYAIVSTQEGKQYNLRASRRLRPRLDELDVGPFWQELIHPMRTLRIGCRENPHHVEFDILWESKAPPYDEAPGGRFWVDGRLVAERSNYVQSADVSGWIKIGGQEWKFEVGDGWAGTRDHSWGMGGTGTGTQGNPFVAPLDGGGLTTSFNADGLRHWAVVNFPDRCLFYGFRVGEDGVYTASGTGRQSGEGVHSWTEYAYNSGKEGFAYLGVEAYEHAWEDGFPRLKQGKVAFTRPDGGKDRYQIDVVSEPVQMRGGGYADGWNDGHGRGVYRGEEVVEGEVWDVSHPVNVFDADGNPVKPFGTGPSFAEVYAKYTNFDDPTDVGLGILEAVIMTEYEGVKGP